ncbi:MAG: hypothetical protein GF364_20310 [Candidatus Lokiarchaeota archaeon]|nr:hypothetical protein [Candidatus Lokiarchaeota archaeon]
MQSIRWRNNNTTKSILNILLSASEKGIKIPDSQIEKWKMVVEGFVKRNEPVTLAMSLAVGTRIPNRLKFFDDVNLPTLGWMYFFYFFQMLNQKICMVYPSGIRLVIFDEAWLFGKYLGVSREFIEINLRAVKKIIELMKVPVEIILMKEKDFDLAEVDKIEPKVNLSQIYGFLCSLPDMNNPNIMHSLYRKRKRNYQIIQREAGDLWKEAETKAKRVAQYLTWRKQSNLFGNLIGEEYIDTTITDKDGRLVLDITCALMNHGMPVVRCNDLGLLKVDIVPEYRIPVDYPNAVPVWINKSDLIPDMDGNFKFYYLEA